MITQSRSRELSRTIRESSVFNLEDFTDTTDDLAVSDAESLAKLTELLDLPISPQDQLEEVAPGSVVMEGKKYPFLGYDVENFTGPHVWRSTYVCLDRCGQRIKVEPKNREEHDSWHPIQEYLAYHLRLNTILAHFDEVALSTSTAHQKSGIVLIYTKYNYIKSLGIPESDQYVSDKTQLVVKYGYDGNNRVLTSIVCRASEAVDN